MMKPSEVREHLGLTRQGMANAMGVHYETWGKWERGLRKPDNAALNLMRLIVWLYDYHPKMFKAWVNDQ